MRFLLRFLIAAAAASTSPASAENQFIAAAVSGFVIPAYSAFQAASAELRDDMDALCGEPSPEQLAAAREAFIGGVTAWSRVEIVRFGPVTEENRLERILYWPDRKSTGLKQVQRALTEKDATATDAATLKAAGVIGAYDAGADFQRVGEFPTHGVGPHELLLLADGRTLAVANGGIETHPDFGRAKLNLSTREPSLVFIDRLSGDLIERHELPPELHQLSIRHMAVDRSGAVWFGCQHEGPASERPALVGRARRGESFGLIDMPEDVLGGLRNYVGSVAANAEAGTIAVSSPHGNALVIIEAAGGHIVSTSRLVEVCGIAPDRSSFLVTTGAGEIIDPEGGSIEAGAYAWDNHLSRIG